MPSTPEESRFQLGSFWSHRKKRRSGQKTRPPARGSGDKNGGPANKKGLRACLNPPPKRTGTNRMQYYLPDELVLIGCRHRTASMQPEKNSFQPIGRRRTCLVQLGPLHDFIYPNMSWTPFFFTDFRRTERPDRTGTSKVLFDGDLTSLQIEVDTFGAPTRCCRDVACAKGYRS